MSQMSRVTPFLWFNKDAEEAAKLYVSIFKKNSKIKKVSRMGPKGPVQSVAFTLDGREFIAFNGGPMFTFSTANSLYVSCKTQKEIDYYWSKLSKGGSDFRCGWLKDRFGLSWQIIPDELTQLLWHKDKEKAQRAFQAMLKMEKLVIQDLKDAVAFAPAKKPKARRKGA